MKLKTKLWIIIGALVVACLCLLVNTWRVGSKVSYHKGRADKALEELQQAEIVFEEAIEQDAAFQKEKDERIAELEAGIVEDKQEIEVAEEDIVDARATLIELNLYKGWVIALDKGWKVKYGKLEGVVEKKDKQLKEWQEKFDSKVKVAIKAYTDKDLAQKKVIKELQGLCNAQEKQIKGLKFWTVVGKGLTGYHAVKGGINLAKGIL